MEKPKNIALSFTLLVVVLVAVIFISLGIGRYSVSPTEIIKIITGAHSESLDANVFFTIRLPRIIAALLIGSALSVSGATYQGIFRNPLVSPDILGAAAGASFGAALAIFLGLGKIWLQISAFGFGIVGVATAYIIGVRLSGRMRDNTVTLVLCGMVITAIFSALISAVKLVADPYDELPTITFWLMGGLNYVVKEDILIMIAPLLIGGITLFLMRFRLNVLALSDEEINALGINAETSRRVVILCATLMTSSAVAVGGMIAWVGLLVPHISRLITGPDFRKLLPASLLIGAIFLLIVDDVARSILQIELPLGVLTALIGAPVFLVLLARTSRE